ncbi:MAG: PLDc N-terminal domain-containing protein [Chloroflexota bacterium]|nr:PLDc N-terminal domain-containing protein [Chloroflexota bacterium]
MALLEQAVTALTSFYTSTYPVVLYGTWVVLSLWDLMRREEMTERDRLLWGGAVMFLPLVGPLSYLLLSDTRLSWNLRMLVTAGGAVVYVAATTAIALLT